MLMFDFVACPGLGGGCFSLLLPTGVTPRGMPIRLEAPESIGVIRDQDPASGRAARHLNPSSGRNP